MFNYVIIAVVFLLVGIITTYVFVKLKNKSISTAVVEAPVVVEPIVEKPIVKKRVDNRLKLYKTRLSKKERELAVKIDNKSVIQYLNKNTVLKNVGKVANTALQKSTQGATTIANANSARVAKELSKNVFSCSIDPSQLDVVDGGVLGSVHKNGRYAANAVWHSKESAMKTIQNVAAVNVIFNIGSFSFGTYNYVIIAKRLKEINGKIDDIYLEFEADDISNIKRMMMNVNNYTDNYDEIISNEINRNDAKHKIIDDIETAKTMILKLNCKIESKTSNIVHKKPIEYFDNINRIERLEEKRDTLLTILSALCEYNYQFSLGEKSRNHSNRDLTDALLDSENVQKMVNDYKENYNKLFYVDIENSEYTKKHIFGIKEKVKISNSQLLEKNEIHKKIYINKIDYYNSPCKLIKEKDTWFLLPECSS